MITPGQSMSRPTSGYTGKRCIPLPTVVATLNLSLPPSDSSESDGKWDYYTLECLLYFLKNIKRSHPDYVKQARGEVPIVHRPDRRSGKELRGFFYSSSGITKIAK